jgi:hypothetical protein
LEGFEYLVVQVVIVRQRGSLRSDTNEVRATRSDPRNKET